MSAVSIRGPERWLGATACWRPLVVTGRHQLDCADADHDAVSAPAARSTKISPAPTAVPPTGPTRPAQARADARLHPVRQGIVAVDLRRWRLHHRTAGAGGACGGRVDAQVPRAPSAGLLARLANRRSSASGSSRSRSSRRCRPRWRAAVVDLVTLMFNYHDLGHMGVDRERMNRAVFAALRARRHLRDRRPCRPGRHRHLGIGHAAPGRGGVRPRRGRGGRLSPARIGAASCATRTIRATRSTPRSAPSPRTSSC